MQKKIQNNSEIKRKAEAGLPILVFQEDDIHIVYSPSFDISGYGRTEKEAIESFRIVRDETLLYMAT
jgi:hypothetical protein